MRLSAATVALCGLVPAISAYATPTLDSIGPAGLLARDNDADPCALASSPNVNASVQLASWMQCQVNGFFPYPANGAWDAKFADAFDTSLHATFNDTQYTYSGWLALYKSFNTSLGPAFAPFKHGFLDTVGVPNANGDLGGFVYLLGWEGGYSSYYKTDLYFTDATFAVVKEIDGQRKITEMRESSNIPNTAPKPDPQNWQC